jgi:hypothetical protein
MPEYLAPGVYVEETSFRAKSIEGVGTSTTAFVGPTRTGPVGGTPEILTSFGDFERIFGGLDDLSLPIPTNYVAHGVRAYFDNGGARLYVSRVFLGSDSNTGKAVSADFTNGGADATKQSVFRARFPGDAGNGTIAVRQVASPATVRSMGTAAEGTLLRLGGDQIAAGAQTAGWNAAVLLANDGVLLLNIDGVDAAEIKFHGEPAEAIGTPLGDPVTLDDTNRILRVTIDGVPQVISLTAGDIARDDLVDAINSKLVGGYAHRTNDQRLAIGSDRKGTRSSVTVGANPTLGFAADTSVNGTSVAANNVGDLNKVTADEINNLLAAAGLGVSATFSAATGKLVLTSATAGTTSNLTVRDDPKSVHAGLGLQAGTQVKGTAGATNTFFVKRGNAWVDPSNNALNLGGLAPGTTPNGQPADFITLNVVTEDKDHHTASYEDLGLDPGHPRSIAHVLAMKQARRLDDLENGFAVELGSAIDAFQLRAGLFGTGSDRLITLSGGNDGGEPIQKSYEDALAELEKLEDISIVAAPGHSAYADAAGIEGAVISHADKRRSYRIAVLDTPPQQQSRKRAPHALDRFDPCCALLPVGRRLEPVVPPRAGSDPARAHAAAQRIRVRHLRAQRRRARRLEGARQRSRARRAPLRDRHQLRATGGPESPRRELPALFSGPRLPRLGRADGELGPRVEVRERAPLLHLPRGVDRSGHAVGGVRAERRGPVGQHPREP